VHCRNWLHPRYPNGIFLTIIALGESVSREIELPTLRPRKSIALIGLGMGAYFLYLYHVGYQDVISSLRNVDMTVFLLAVVTALLGVFFDAMAWQAIVQKFDYKVPSGHLPDLHVLRLHEQPHTLRQLLG